ncbi:calcium-binding protein [Dongia deserti]|uniref:calcium-binding protein n=1 Tax=Dongia deserti TaxID=2268030 RepID=UPI000E64B8A5|nr:calcium-binding protein [Dongia deserti]
MLSRSGSGDLVLKIVGTNDVLTVQNNYTNFNDHIEKIEFADGTVWDAQFIRELLLTATPGDDRLVGFSADEVFDGGAGNDRLEGGDGADTYVFGRGYGQDVVVDHYKNANIIQLNSDTAPTDVKLSTSSDGKDLVLEILGTSDKLVVEGQVQDWRTSRAGITEVRFADGTVWSASEIKSNLIVSTPGNDIIQGFWDNDTLDGGAGNDTLQGGIGSDTYIFGRGYGQDVVYDNSYSYNILRLNPDVAPSDVRLSISPSGQDLVLEILGTSDKLTWSGQWYDWHNDSLNRGLAAIEFADGTVWSAEEIISTFLTATSGNDSIVGSWRAELINGGDGDDYINGMRGADTLVGGAGNDTLDGGAGFADKLIGGLGNDTYRVDRVDDLVIEKAGEGIDLVQSSVTYTLSTNVENLTLTGTSAINGTGNELDNSLVGNSGTNQLKGLAGDDTLDGGGGVDTLIGGSGNDRYIADSNDTIIEDADEGIDTVVIQANYTLGANLENLILGGSSNYAGTGNELNNRITGNSGANLLSGGDGDDTLDGGAGADTMVGGSGDDTFVVQQTTDVVIENADEGIDTIESSITITALANNVENLKLTGAANLNGTGNALDNLIVGNSGNNVLDGGVGTDTLAGGAGNDTYIIGDSDDVIIENAGEGVDLVQSSVNHALSANIENLTLTGSTDISGTGNESDNTLIGNSGANQLSGGAGNDTLNGGTGADTLIGGTGDDLYVVDNTADVVVENAGEGTDTVQSSVTYELSANVENLTLTGVLAINGTGNDLDNVLIGNSANNQLSGGAGNDRLDGSTGNDTMIGGLGDDVYVVQAGGDVVTENANEGIDTIESSITILSLAANVENLILTGAASLSGTGNSLNNVLIGNSAANTLNGGTGVDTLIGGAGNDTYVVDETDDVVIENAAEGTDLVQASATYTLTANIENLTLTGTAAINGTGNELNNAITGNSGANQLSGCAGNDTLNGGTGADTLIGGAGDDLYVVDNTGDVVTEGAGEGIDTVQSSVTYTLAANIENLTLTGSSGINGTGNALDNVITGNSGNNVLDGGAGADSLAGGAGNDTYIVDDAGDVVTENLNQGTADLVQASISWSLGANIENLTLTGSAAINGTGNELNNVLTGNAGANQLTGGDGNDTLDGGAGADTLVGGTGNDTYVVDNAGDVVQENADEGIDTVQSSITWTLAANFENLSLTGSSAINGTGNELDNALIGNTGANQLIGGAGNDTLNGGTGADTLVGGSGDDIYVVDNAADVVTELAGEGTDLVQSSVTYTLAANVENLTLTGSSATNGTGNALNNVITGNTGNNILDGGIGADTLIGGTGNDTYVVDDINDLVIELANQGTADLVQSSVSYTLVANVENLTLMGSAVISGTGNELNNAITGNTAANLLIGGDGNDTLNGGAGADTLIGGAGNDTYVVDNIGDVTTEDEGEGIDTIQSSITWALAANIEHLTLTGSSAINGTGNALDNALTGNSGANQLSGGDGDDTLNGGSGVDTLIGGAGNDTYVVDNVGDVVTEGADAGVDLVQASVTYTLAANIENLTLTGSSGISGTGNALDNILIGNTGANQLNGGAGNDRLDGGAGNDTMTGGIGDDTYVVQQTGDVVIENAGEGIDTIESSITIAALANNVENLILTGPSAINGTGNTLNNLIIGNSAANTLGGGAGNDTLQGGGGIDNLLGGDGDDLLVWDSVDTLNGGAGLDTLRFTGSGTLQFDSARMVNLEAIDLGAGDDNNNGVALSVSDVLNLASSSGGSGISANGDDVDLFILGDAEGDIRDAVSLSGGWTAAGTLSTSALNGSLLTFDLYQSNGVQVAVQQGLDQLIA